MRYFLDSVVLMLVVLNPVAIALLYVSMAARHGKERREAMARTASWVAFCLLSVFALCGDRILAILGISMASFHVAGGFLLLIVGFRILRAQDNSDALEDGSGGEQLADIGLTPLAVPIITGPASISAAILQAGRAAGLWQILGLLLAIGCAIAVTCYLLLLAVRGTKWLGTAVMKLFFRLSGLILIALAVQFILSGLEQTDLVAHLLAA
jgi:multiple antibiotic resistance protein